MEKNTLIKELQNTHKKCIKDIFLNKSTKDSSTIFTLNKRKIYPEGKVKFGLDTFIHILCDNKYELRLSLNYYNSRYEHYIVEHNIESLNDDYLVREIVRQISEILNKDVITKNDFKGFICTARIITELDSEGIQYSKFIDIKVKRIESEYCTLKNTNVLEKDFYDLNKNDVDSLVNIFKIDKNSSMYKDKLSIIENFCEQRVDVDNFLYKGKTMMKLTADLDIDVDSSINNPAEYLHDYILDKLKYFDIKPRCIFIVEDWCCLEYFPSKYFHFNNWSDYLGLLIDFITHLENIDIEGVKVVYRPLDEYITRDIDEDAEILGDVKFTKELFDPKDHIEFYGHYAYFLSLSSIN